MSVPRTHLASLRVLATMGARRAAPGCKVIEGGLGRVCGVHYQVPVNGTGLVVWHGRINTV